MRMAIIVIKEMIKKGGRKFMMKLVWVYLLVINIIGFVVMYMDKEKAKRGQYRIPEATLWKIALIGGAVGTSIGMKLFKHKTKVSQFKYGFPAVALVYVIIVFYIIVF